MNINASPKTRQQISAHKCEVLYVLTYPRNVTPFFSYLLQPLHAIVT